MVSHRPPRARAVAHVIASLAAAIGASALLLAPASAQFWNPFGGQPRPKAPVQQQQKQQPRQPQQYNPFSGWFGASQPTQRPAAPGQRPGAAEFSQAPPPARRPPDAAPVRTPIVVLGDAMADWLAYGLEDAFAERPDFGIVRKHRTASGLTRYDPRRDVEWPQVAREIVAAERPKVIVMMVGFHDRQPIRERNAAAPRPAAPAGKAAPADDEFHDPETPEARAKASAEQQNLELEQAAKQDAPAATPEPQAPRGATGPLEFQSEAWQAAYVRRIDATIAAMKSANVPVFWVGLPPQRNARQAADAVYLNDLYRQRAERAGVVFVDIWDGFVDEAGRYMVQGADFEGQVRRLRSGDGIYFTRAGARKLAHYVEREILRALLSRDAPIALPLPEATVPPPALAKGRPLAGPVIPLTASAGGQELLGGAKARPLANDPFASRVLLRGEAITAPVGRADNFSWPRGTGTIHEGDPEPVAVSAPPALPPATRPTLRSVTQPPPSAAVPPPPRAKAPPSADGKPPATTDGKPAPRRIPPRASNDGAPRPPLGLVPR